MISYTDISVYINVWLAPGRPWGAPLESKVRGGVLLWLYVCAQVPEREACTQPRTGFTGNRAVRKVTKRRGDEEAEPRLRS